MFQGDILGLVMVYLYVAILLFISEKFLSYHPHLGRKFLHIMVGNILFMLPFFSNRWIMTFMAAAPFIVLTFLLSPYSPIEIKHRVSAYGHGLGLVYYSISWTLLAFFFFHEPWIIAIGIAAMSYGDGFASLIGERFGRRKYNIFGDEKSLEGSFSMFIALLIVFPLILCYYNQALIPIRVIGVAATATLIEGLTPRGLDNLSVSIVAVTTYIFI